MNRAQKIQMIKALAEGKSALGHLLPPKWYEFTYYESKPGFVEHDGKLMTDEEAIEIFLQLEKERKIFPDRVIWVEGKTYE